MYLKIVQSYCFNSTKVLFILLFTFSISCHKKKPGLIYIVEWTISNDWAYLFLEMGKKAFMKRNCTYQNCFLTKDRSYFNNVLDFDVLLFNIIHVANDTHKFDPPPMRSQSQLYVLVALEPASYNTISSKFNRIFNMTWSYKLTAGILYPYLLVRNKDGEVIGPKKNMHWEYDIKDMAPTNYDTVYMLRNKNIAAATVISNCYAISGRYKFITRLKKELLQYGHQVDIYGRCPHARRECSRIPGEKNGLITKCASKIESDYYFYLAFENSKSEDYVSEKVLHGLNHFAVPVVYGGANYSSFMPNGIYLDAGTLGVEKLAKEINSIIRNPQRYIDFFKWHGYYTFYDTYGFEHHDKYSVCNICAKLNKRIKDKRRTVYTSITKWWNPNNAGE